MAINKNFVVKHGLEVNSNLILANADTKKVGIGSTNPQYTLDIRGGLGVTDVYVSGVATIAVGIITNLSGTNLNYNGVATIATGVITNLSGTNLNYNGVGTFSNELNVGTGGTVLTALNTGLVGIGTTTPVYALHVIGPATGVGTALYVDGDVRITGDINVDDISFDDATVENITVTDTLLVGSGGGSGIATIGTLGVSGITTTQHLRVAGVSTFVGLATFNNGLQVVSGITTLGTTTATNVDLQSVNVSGTSTLGTVRISTGIITAASGIVTYYGDGSFLTGNARNLTATIGIGTSGGVVGTGVSFLDLRGPGLSTVTVDNNTGIATIFFQGGGSGSASIGIGTTPGEAFTGIITAGNLWYNSNIGRLFIYYQDVDTAQWVDAAPFNVGIITSVSNVSFVSGSALTPSMYFIGDQTTGFFSPGSGQFTIVSLGSSILNVNSGGINVTGVATATDFDSLSDINYKENINTVNNALLKVEQMRGVKFNWKNSGNPSYGVIAQELQEVLPELVHGDNPKTVNYNGIIGVLIEAIKELKAEIEELKNAK